MNAEIQYLELVQKILDKGKLKKNRTGIDTLYLFGEAIRHDFSEGFPLLTTKKMFTKGIIIELLWFLKGTEDTSFLHENGINIWDEWMEEENGKKILRNTYGKMWRNFHGVDQITKLIEEIKTNPDSRRLLVSAWDASKVDNCSLPWCHYSFMIDADQETKELSIAVTQRSCDVFLGLPFNLASYAALLYMLCEVTGYKPKSMFYTLLNTHLYTNHIDACKLQLTRKPYDLPQLKLHHRDNIDDFILEDFNILRYTHHPAIKADIAV